MNYKIRWSPPPPLSSLANPATESPSLVDMELDDIPQDITCSDLLLEVGSRIQRALNPGTLSQLPPEFVLFGTAVRLRGVGTFVVDSGSHLLPPLTSMSGRVADLPAGIHAFTVSWISLADDSIGTVDVNDEAKDSSENPTRSNNESHLAFTRLRLLDAGSAIEFSRSSASSCDEMITLPINDSDIMDKGASSLISGLVCKSVVIMTYHQLEHILDSLDLKDIAHSHGVFVTRSTGQPSARINIRTFEHRLQQTYDSTELIIYGKRMDAVSVVAELSRYLDRNGLLGDDQQEEDTIEAVQLAERENESETEADFLDELFPSLSLF